MRAAGNNLRHVASALGSLAIVIDDYGFAYGEPGAKKPCRAMLVPFLSLEVKSFGFDGRKMDDLIAPSTSLLPKAEQMQGNLSSPEHEIQPAGYPME